MPTRFPGGLNTETPATKLENLSFINPLENSLLLLKGQTWADVTLTSPQTFLSTTVGTGTRAYGGGGAAQVFGTYAATNSAADNDSISVQSRGKVALAAQRNKPIFFSTKVSVNTASLVNVLLGIGNATTTPIGGAGVEETGISDGMFFLKVTGTSVWRFYVRSGSTTVVSNLNLGTLVAGTFVTLSFEYVPKNSTVKIWVNDTQVSTLTIPVNGFPAVDMAAHFAVENGDAVARALLMEYLMVSQDR
jgi:hypothetical protein